MACFASNTVCHNLKGGTNIMLSTGSQLTFGRPPLKKQGEGMCFTTF